MKRYLLMFLLSAIATSWAQQPPNQNSPEPGVYQPRPLSAETIKQKTEILHNPGLAVDNAKQVLSEQTGQPMPGPATLSLEKNTTINDPTQMTGSFTQALGRVQGKAGQSAAPAEVPDIQLLARSIRSESHKSAVLAAGGKSHMVKEGASFSFLSGQSFYEIQVLRIEKDFVELTLMPNGKRMLLQ
jgi:hypothetical protein